MNVLYSLLILCSLNFLVVDFVEAKRFGGGGSRSYSAPRSNPAPVVRSQPSRPKSVNSTKKSNEANRNVNNATVTNTIPLYRDDEDRRSSSTGDFIKGAAVGAVVGAVAANALNSSDEDEQDIQSNNKPPMSNNGDTNVMIADIEPEEDEPFSIAWVIIILSIGTLGLLLYQSRKN